MGHLRAIEGAHLAQRGALPRHPALLEYVIVHEAVHLAEGSHGPRFRALMDLHLPDWRGRRTQLDATT